jgi:hypothetical protein
MNILVLGSDALRSAVDTVSQRLDGHSVFVSAAF